MRLLAAFLLSATLFAASPQDEIRKVLDDQVAAWNRGDIPAFLAGYEHSAEVTFVGNEVTKGYEGVLARYQKRYPTKAAMGTLRFTGLEIKPLDPNYAYAIGRFHLDNDRATGLFTLLLKKTPAGWKIVLDHTN